MPITAERLKQIKNLEPGTQLWEAVPELVAEIKRLRNAHDQLQERVDSLSHALRQCATFGSQMVLLARQEEA